MKRTEREVAKDQKLQGIEKRQKKNVSLRNSADPKCASDAIQSKGKASARQQVEDKEKWKH